MTSRPKEHEPLRRWRLIGIGLLVVTGSLVISATARWLGYLPGMLTRYADFFGLVALGHWIVYFFAVSTGHLFVIGPRGLYVRVKDQPEKFHGLLWPIAIFGGTFTAAWVIWPDAAMFHVISPSP